MHAYTSICVWFYPTGRFASPFFLAGVRECQPRGFIPALHTQRHSTQATNLLPRTCSLHGYKHINCFPRLLTHDSSISFLFSCRGRHAIVSPCISSFYAHVHSKYFPMQRLPKHSPSRCHTAHLIVHGLVPSVACPFEAPLLIPHVLVTTRSTLLQVASYPDALARPRSAPTNKQVCTYAQ